MKISTNHIPIEGFVAEEEVSAAALDIETELIKFPRPIRVRAKVSRITNALTVDLTLSGQMQMGCGRCLKDFTRALSKSLRLNYEIERQGQEIDLDPDIREEIILDYPINPLCDPDCKGLCQKCGADLNQGKCGCPGGATESED